MSWLPAVAGGHHGQMSSSGPRAGVYAGIGLLAAAVTTYQVALTRIFSYAIWHHFAFMVISVALLGFAVSGVLLALWPRLAERPAATAGRLALAFSVSSVLALVIVGRLPFDPTRFADDSAQWFALAAVYLAMLVPFTAAGAGIVVLLRAYPRSVERLYASDLASAGSASLVAVGAIAVFGGDGLAVFSAALSALAGVVLCAGLARGVAGLVALAALAAIPGADRVLSLEPVDSKALVTMLDKARFPDARVVATRWNAISRIDLVEDSGTVPWTRNPNSPHPEPEQALIVIDADATTPLLAWDGDPASQPFLDYTISSVVPQALAPRRALVIGPGGGIDVLTLVRHGVEQVDAVEVNPIIAELVSEGPFADYGGGLFARQDVRLIQAEGRSFVRAGGAPYDLIQLSLIDTWAASLSGAYSLTEGYLYTVEAFQDYLELLSEDGVLSITRWLHQPPRETLKVVTVASAALAARGVEQPARHVAVIRLGNIGNTLIKRTPFKDEELAALLRVATQRGFRALHLPTAAGQNPISNYLEAASEREREAFVEDYPYDVRPATDDRPFFFQFGRWRDLGVEAWREAQILLSGRLVLLALLAQAALLSLVLILLPLLVVARRQPVCGERTGPWGALAYFGAIGLAFMLLEIALMQRFTLFLGQPVHALALIFVALLGGAGLGSSQARRLGAARPGAPWVFGAIAGGAVAYTLLLPPIFEACLGLAFAGRALLSLALILPLGFMLGLPFPMALMRMQDAGREDLTAWAWAANGCASVIGPIVAVLLAFDVGFTGVLLLAAGVYLAAGWILARWLPGCGRA